MDPETRRLVAFTRARIEEDLKSSGLASKHFDIEATAHMTSQTHANFVRRYGPEWVRDECVRKAAIISWEESQDSQLQTLDPPLTAAFMATRIIASGWLDHPDFESGWLGK